MGTATGWNHPAQISWNLVTHWPTLLRHGPLARYVYLRVAHAPGMPGTFSPPPRVSDPDMHHGTCVMHVPWCMPGSLTSGFLWSRWRGKRSRHSRRMRNPQFYVSGKRLLCVAFGRFVMTSLTKHSWPRKCSVLKQGGPKIRSKQNQKVYIFSVSQCTVLNNELF